MRWGTLVVVALVVGCGGDNNESCAASGWYACDLTVTHTCGASGPAAPASHPWGFPTERCGVEEVRNEGAPCASGNDASATCVETTTYGKTISVVRVCKLWCADKCTSTTTGICRWDRKG